MHAPAVVFDRVWKQFQRGERHDTLRDLLPSLARRIVRRRVEPLGDKAFWALQGVSFEVAAGEALGIIGPNGAGKSTTLKLLSRILKPTEGVCRVRGRVGALIEVAAGFHPDLTGRENIYFQGAIMGMTRAEIAHRFPDIVDFAGVEAFIDTPVKRYSTGMQARLGFSIAAHLQPDVLLIDEVLSVGDMAFQQRCVERMRDFKRQGVTIVFVSHNLQAVASLCDRALFLRGTTVALGPAQDVVRTYVTEIDGSNTSHRASGVAITGARLLDHRAGTAAVIHPGATLTLRVNYAACEDIADLHLGFIVYRSEDGLVVYGGNVDAGEIGIDRLRAGETVTVDFTFVAHLARGHYHVECHAFHNPTQRHLSRLCPAAVLTIEESRTYAGVADVELTCRAVEGRRPDLARRDCAAAGVAPV